MRNCVLVGTFVLAATPFAALAQVGLDGVIGAEWAGATVKTVSHDPAAPTSNFGAPTNQTAFAAYDTYFRVDSGWVYLAVATNGTGGGSAGDFANVYLGSIGAGSNIGFEVINNNFFVPGVPGNFNNLALPAGQRAEWSIASGVVELAIPFSFFQTDPLAMGFAPTPDGGTVRWNLSQSFGYSVAGGASFYGTDRLGAGVIPTPASAMVLGVAALVARRRRR